MPTSQGEKKMQFQESPVACVVHQELAKKRTSQCQQKAQGTQKGLEMHMHQTFYIQYMRHCGLRHAILNYKYFFKK